MFWNRGKETEKKERPAENQAKKGDGGLAVKTKPVTPKDTIIQAVEGVTAEKGIAFILPKDFGNWQLAIELNPQYPGKGKKYVASREDLVDGNPNGNKFHQFDTNHSREIAEWVLDRKAALRQA